jgi:hypothetical protein
VTPPGDLDEAVQELIDANVASSPLTLRIGKAGFYDQLASG